MRKFFFIFVALFITSTSVALGVPCDATVAGDCAQGKTGTANKLTCSLGIYDLCLKTDDNIFACKANAEVHDIPLANGSCKCNAGYFQNATGDTCTACAIGSYQDATGQTNCKPCTDGKTTSAVGQTTCAPDCPTIANLGDWSVPVWNAAGNTVTNLCLADTCLDGYHPSTDKTSCDGNTYTVRFNTGGGTPVPPDVTCTYGTACSWTQTTPIKDGAEFQHWNVPAGISGIGPSSTATNLPATFTDSSLTNPNGNTVITLTAEWQNCADGDGADEWAPGCVITKCKFGYRLGANKCTACNTAGSYCDGTNAAQQDCPRGWYCPIDGTNGTVNADCTTSTAGAIGGVPTTNTAGKCMCPAGATTLAIGATAITACTYTGGDAAICGANGSNCTKFCDGRGCFYLPENVPY